MRMELVVRFDYGSIVPWVRRTGETLMATAGPDTLELDTPVPTHGEHMRTVADFEVGAGDRVPFVLNYRPSHAPTQPVIDAEQTLRDTEAHWLDWSGKCRYEGRWQAPVLRSLITLKALTYVPTGGIVAAPTTSLPEQLGGVRNWDYRFCWLRDATFTLNALLLAGYTDEAEAWREWLLRAVAGSPADMQILYSVTGERRLEELELDWLPGYGGAVPVRIGNAAASQFQLDVYGEVMDTLHLARAAGLAEAPHVWRIQRALLDFLCNQWQEPDEGIWEVRGPRQHFTHSKVMAWVAFDRAVKAVERFGLPGPVAVWRENRDAIHAQVCERGVRRRAQQLHAVLRRDERRCQPAADPAGRLPAAGRSARDRHRSRRSSANCCDDGLLLRYRTESGVDDLPPGEGAFLPCSFWLADCMAVTGRRAEAEALFERLLGLCNDVGLLAEEVEPGTGHLLGNFPQALTHMALINTARLLTLPQQEVDRSCHAGERPTTPGQVP